MYSCCTYGIFNVASLKNNCLLNMTCSTQIKGSGLFLMTSVFPDHIISSPTSTSSAPQWKQCPPSGSFNDNCNLYLQKALPVLCSLICICPWTGMKKISLIAKRTADIQPDFSVLAGHLDSMLGYTIREDCWCAIEMNPEGKFAHFGFRAYPFKPL